MTEPVRISSKDVEVNLTGCLTPAYANGQPFLLRIEGVSDPHIAVFTTKEKLLACWEAFALGPYDKIMQIDHGPEFVQSLSENAVALHLVVDPHKTDTGRMRWIEIPLGNRPLPLVEN